MPRYLLAILVGLAWVGRAPGQDLDTTALMRIVAPHVNDSTQLIGHVNVEKLSLKKYFEILAGLVGPKSKEMAAAREFALAQQARLTRAGVRDVLAVVNVHHFDGSAPPEIIVIVPATKGAELDDLLKLIGQVPGINLAMEKNTLLVRFGPGTAAPPKKRPEFNAGFEALKDKHIRVVAAPSDALRRFAAKALGPLPSDLSAADITVLTMGFRWVGLGYDTARLTQDYLVEANDAQTAWALKALADRGLGILEKMPQAPMELTTLKDLLVVKQQGERLALHLDEKGLNVLLQSSVVRVRQAAARAHSQNNLRQIALAMHSHHDAKKSLPARASFDTSGKPLLSWRVRLLPYLEQQSLYQQFKLDEPWDSAHNRKLIALIPPIYVSPLSKVGVEGKTTYLVPTGKGSMFEANAPRLTDVTDGTSNTIMVIEVNDTKAIDWTRPEDFAIDAKDLLDGLVHAELKGFQAVFGDGSARFLPATTRPATLQALFTRNGGEAIDLDK